MIKNMLIGVWGTEKRNQWQAGRPGICTERSRALLTSVCSDIHRVSSTLHMHSLIMRTVLQLSGHAQEGKMIWREEKKAQATSFWPVFRKRK